MSGSGGLDADTLAALVAEIAHELRGGAGASPVVHLDTDLGRDLGLDSLARMELLARLERAAGASLPERALAEADTPRALLRAFASLRPAAAGRPEAGPPPASAPGPGRKPKSGGQAVPGAEPGADPGASPGAPPDDPPGGAPLPAAAETLVEALAGYAAAQPDRVHVRLLGEGGAETTLTYGGLLAGASRIAAGLARAGLTPGRAVAIMLPTGIEYLECFLGVQLAGGVALPIYPPARLAQVDDHLRRHERILANADAEWLVTFDEVRPLSRLLAARSGVRCRLATVRELRAAGEGAGGGGFAPAAPGPDDVAFLQYTSGSTGQPKGVVLTHRNVLASLQAMARALAVTPRDVFVSWLPLYHDMGLIGGWLGSLVYGFPLVLMSPLAFLARPVRWLRAIDRHRGSLSGGPNFAFDLCTRRIADEELEGLDLSCWRLAFNGAEQVRADTLEAFAARFARCGFEARALAPVYGLAEATLGVAFTPLGRGPRIEWVAPGPLERERRAVPVAAPVESPAGRESGPRPGGAQGQGRPSDEPRAAVPEPPPAGFVSSGPPIPGFEVRTVDEAGRETPERMEGRLQFRGPSVTNGYFRAPEATRALFDGDWLDSGDLAYVAGGEVFVTGRVKDVIIRAGRNLHPYDFEQAAGDLPGVRRGCVALFAARRPGGGAAPERLVAVVETREADPARRTALRTALGRLAEQRLGQPVDEVVLAPPHTVLKTSSGKLRRRAMAERYETGRLAAAGTASWPSWLRLARLALGAIAPVVRQAAVRLGELAFAGRVWAAIGLVGAVVWPAVAVVRRPRFGQACLRTAARTMFRLAGVRLTVEGSVLPRHGPPCVVTTNHASYLDGLVIMAALGRPVRFVAKAELREYPLARWFLDGIGVLYVDRFDTARGVAHAGGLAEALRAGDSIAVFPEGTLHRMPGLLPFQMGAFAAAAEAGAPVVPVVLRGVRSLMRNETWFPRRAPVRVRIGEPIHPPGAALALGPEPRAGAPGPGPGPGSADGDPPTAEARVSDGTGVEDGAPAGGAFGAARSRWSQAVRLRDEVRVWMLAHCGEPDLADRNPLHDLAARRAADRASRTSA